MIWEETDMKRTIKLRDLDCAHCAAKMEREIQRIDGVQSAQINFFTQRMTIEAADDRFGEALLQAARICKRIEPDCELVF